MRTRDFSMVAVLALAALTSVMPPAFGQQLNVVSVAALKTVTVKAGETVEVPLAVTVAEGYHVNSNTPSDPYLIGLRLTWSPGLLRGAEVAFPKPRTEKFGFSETPLSVFAGEFRIVTQFQVAANAPGGLGLVTGKLRYQACNDRSCLPPRTIDVELPVDVKK